MKRYSEDFIKKVREIRRKEGLSFVELGKRFKMHSSTMRNWCHDIEGSRWNTLIKSNEKKRQEIKNSELSVVPNVKSIGNKQAKLIASILYGCEGSKYPAHSGVAFANSDPQLILSFSKLLKKAFVLDTDKFSVHLQIHTTHNYNELKKYWSKLLDLPEKCFIKPTIKEPRGGKHRNGYIGTCTLRYRDYRIQLKMLGIFEKFTKKFSDLI
ncbi:hypothetical protein HYT02_02460 [Candidatus Gottesmanbacteria bacterium]|nr:hypothetical protein [Candidatus Gottesmanbacteria bacterium]